MSVFDGIVRPPREPFRPVGRPNPPVSDTWAPAGAADTHTTKVPGGAYKLAAGQISNLTAATVYVARGGDAPPPTQAAHDLAIAPYGQLMFGLDNTGVVLALAAPPGAGPGGAPALVEIELTDDPAGLGGSAGVVSIASGSVSIAGTPNVNIASGSVAVSGGPINVQTAAGVSVSTTATVTPIGTAAVPASGAAVLGPYAIAAGMQSLLFEWPGVLPLIMKVIGNQSGVRYFVGTIDGTGYVTVPVDAARDTSFNLSVQQVVAGSAATLTISGSTAPAELSVPLLYPYSQLAAVQYGVKNLNTVDVSGKQFFGGAINTAGPIVLIPATAGTAWSLYSFMAIPDAPTPASLLSLGLASGQFICSGNTGHPVNFDWRGAVGVLTGQALNMNIVGALIAWRVHITAAPITT